MSSWGLHSHPDLVSLDEGWAQGGWHAVCRQGRVRAEVQSALREWEAVLSQALLGIFASVKNCWCQ